MSDLAELVRELAKARYLEQERGKVTEMQKRALEQTQEWKALEESRLQNIGFRVAIAELERKVRDAAVATGEKQPHPAVEVKVYEEQCATIATDLSAYLGEGDE